VAEVAPAQAAPVAPPFIPDARTRARRALARARTRVGAPAPGADTPALARRTRRTGPLAPRARQAAEVLPAQVAPVAPPSIPDARARVRRLAVLLRGSTAEVAPAQVAPVAPPSIPDARTRVRRLAVLLRARPRGPATAPSAQAHAPAPARTTSGVRSRAVLRRHTVPAVPTQQAAPTSAGHAMRRAPWPRHGRTAMPVQPAVTPTPPARAPDSRLRRRRVAEWLRRAGFEPGWLPPTVAPAPPPSVRPDVGSWWSLVQVVAEARELRAEDASTPVLSCPVDGTPLVDGPDGQLFCPSDGWPNRPAVHPEHPRVADDEMPVACPLCGEPLVSGRCAYDGWHV
jgi:hypothetical protein